MTAVTKKEKEAHAALVVGVDGLKTRASRAEAELTQVREILSKQELAILELGGRLERAERVITGMLGQGVYRSDLEIMKKWMGNRWVVPVAKGFGLTKNNGEKAQSPKEGTLEKA
jgi:hypothetical protein